MLDICVSIINKWFDLMVSHQSHKMYKYKQFFLQHQLRYSHTAGTYYKHPDPWQYRKVTRAGIEPESSEMRHPDLRCPCHSTTKVVFAFRGKNFEFLWLHVDRWVKLNSKFKFYFKRIRKKCRWSHLWSTLDTKALPGNL